MLHYVAFDWFFQGVTLTQADVDFDWGVKRAWGLRLQPNYLASELCMMLPVALLVRQNMSARLGLMIVTAFGVMLTGSRGGMIICVLVIAVTALNYLWNHPRNADFLKAGLVWSPPLALCLLIYISLFGIEDQISGLIERFAELLQMLSGGAEKLAASSDDSLQARTILRDQVMQAFWRKPLFGYGCGGMRTLWEEGTLSRVTHNTFHYYMLDYGILYLVGFALLLLSLIWKWWRFSIFRVVHQPLIWTFLAVTIVGGSCSMAVKSNAYAVLLATVLSVYLFAMGHFPHHKASWLGVK
jgi:O-antigen ligase